MFDQHATLVTMLLIRFIKVDTECLIVHAVLLCEVVSPEKLKRFQNAEKMLTMLNHPKICFFIYFMLKILEERRKMNDSG